MNIKMKYFSVEEAQGLTTKLSGLFHEAQETKGHIEKKVNEWRRVHKTVGVADEAVLRGQVDFLATQLEVQLNQITELGCIPKDLDMGLVDFPSRVQGKEGYLCWKVGEPKVEFWHGITDGFRGRKKITEVERA